MLHYEKLMELKPLVYSTILNKKNQKITLVEHPTKGDLSEVICVCHELKLAAYSDFFDTCDMEDNPDYMPYFIDGKLVMGFEI